MCWETMKGFAVVGAFALFASVFGGLAVWYVAGPSMLGSYTAGVFGSLVVAFVIMVYQKFVDVPKRKKR